MPPVEPVEPVASRFGFDVSAAPRGEDFLGAGADLEPGTLLAAYRAGVFPMPVSRHRTGRIGWWSPDPRGVIPLDGLHVSRSLRAACRRFEIRVDTAYDDVVSGCAAPGRPGGWIRRDIATAYRALYDLGWVHSVEAWSIGDDGRDRLSGGLYGVAIGGLFAGESMFHGPMPQDRDASKVALVGLVELLRAAGAEGRLLDVQWATDHLVSLGAVEVARPAYLDLLAAALDMPGPDLPPRRRPERSLE
jgi:leucyl/phenylalanyl-tRNA--protein transferase